MEIKEEFSDETVKIKQEFDETVKIKTETDDHQFQLSGNFIK